MFLLFLYIIIYNYFNYEHFNFINKYFEKYDDDGDLTNRNLTENLQNSRMQNFFIINKIYKFFNFLYDCVFTRHRNQ